ncbi:MAG: circularly permuted type 2 ATP-grasp protein, partial [Gammaproteobacteria bacterium]|nr:circularly permuted type 2 ATP-grasp protein [Gammaproteobacteria bacterium]
MALSDKEQEPTRDWYQSEPGVFDEMCEADGQPRAHWDYFARAVQTLGTKELARRQQEALRLLRENGVTYNVYDDQTAYSRPWELDPIPFLVGSEEWTTIEAGLTQRAELFNLILTDLYGPRELIKKGVLPLELIYSHLGFLRPCDKVGHAGQHQLIIHAVDLARGPDGGMWVVGDHTQAPSGAGYALENRMAMTRILPSLFRDCHVHRLALFFHALRSGLASISPTQDNDPYTVILTPGPRNETYFEHAYLASYLGYTLVQGDDLTVRDGKVWLKSLDGLQPV